MVVQWQGHELWVAGCTLCSSSSSIRRTPEASGNSLSSGSQTYFSLHLYSSQGQLYSRNCFIYEKIHTRGHFGGLEMVLVRVIFCFHLCASMEVFRDTCFVTCMNEEVMRKAAQMIPWNGLWLLWWQE